MYFRFCLKLLWQLTSKEIIEKANEMGLKKIKAQNSAVSMEEAEAI